MNWSEILTIYLACGAPVGVYYFLQRRDDGFSVPLFFKSCIAALLWIPALYSIWRNKRAKGITKRPNFSSDAETGLLEQRAAILQKRILRSFVELSGAVRAGVKPEVSFFTFRDALECYAGLTLAVAADEAESFENGTEIFKIAGRGKAELALAGKCLSRRNRIRLYDHQNHAREDILQELAKLGACRRHLNEGKADRTFSELKDGILELFELIDVKSLTRAESALDAAGVNADLTNRSRQENGFHKQEIRSCQPQATHTRQAQVQTQQ